MRMPPFVEEWPDTLESLMNLPVQNRPSFDFAIAKMVEAEIQKEKDVRQKCSSKSANSAIM